MSWTRSIMSGVCELLSEKAGIIRRSRVRLGVRVVYRPRRPRAVLQIVSSPQSPSTTTLPFSESPTDVGIEPYTVIQYSEDMFDSRTEPYVTFPPSRAHTPKLDGIRTIWGATGTNSSHTYCDTVASEC